MVLQLSESWLALWSPFSFSLTLVSFSLQWSTARLKMFNSWTRLLQTLTVYVIADTRYVLNWQLFVLFYRNLSQPILSWDHVYREWKTPLDYPMCRITKSSSLFKALKATVPLSRCSKNCQLHHRKTKTHGTYTRSREHYIYKLSLRLRQNTESKTAV